MTCRISVFNKKITAIYTILSPTDNVTAAQV